MTTIEISLELIAIVLILVAVLLVGYFCIFVPFSQEYVGPRGGLWLECPHCGQLQLECGGDYYYCHICDKKLKRKAK